MKHYLFILIFLALPVCEVLGQAQGTIADIYFEALEASPDGEEAPAAEEASEDWMVYRLDLNRVAVEDLLTLPVLTPEQSEDIIRHRHVFGPYLSVYELQAVTSLDQESIKNLLPYVMIRENHLLTDPRSFGERLKSVEKRFLLRTSWRRERAAGYIEEGGYLGNGPSLYSRVLLRQPQDFSIGLAVEQDAGEPYRFDLPAGRIGTDQVSAHFMLENRGAIRKVVAGDYRFHTGSGLIFGGGFPGGKWPADLTMLRPAPSGLQPHTSGREGAYFRGAGVTLQHGQYNATFFASARKMDAAIDSVSRSFSSLLLPAYHRTEKEWSKAAQLPVHTGGAELTYLPGGGTFRAGLTLTGTRLGYEWRPTPKVYSPDPYTGSKWAHAGAWFAGSYRQAYFFGEMAKVFPGGMAAMSGMLLSFSRYDNFAIIGRHYTQDYHSFYGSSFGEGSGLSNESGLYTALTISPAKRIKVTLGADHFVFPGLRFRTYAPTNGREYFAAVRGEGRTLQWSVTYRDKTKPRNSQDENTTTYELVDFRKKQVAARLKYAPEHSPFTWQSRIYWNRTLPDDKHGFGVAQDLSVKTGKWSFAGRVALFDTETFDNRLYLYEQDVWGTFSIPMYYGQGLRTYWLVRYKATRQLSLWARMGRFRYRDRTSISSDLAEIEGDKATDFRLQLAYRWW